jgi:hypothetical protein
MNRAMVNPAAALRDPPQFVEDRPHQQQQQPLENSKACCPKDIKISPKADHEDCVGRIVASVHAKWSATGNLAGVPCDCSCCEARQFVAFSLKSWVPGMEKPVDLDIPDLVAGPIWETAHEGDFARSFDEEWYKAYVRRTTVMSWSKEGKKFEAKKSSVPLIHDVLFHTDEGPLNPFGASERFAEDFAPGKNRIRALGALTSKVRRFGKHGELKSKVGKCDAKWKDHIQAPPPNQAKGSTIEMQITLVVVIRPILTKKECTGGSKQAECALGIYTERTQASGKCDVKATEKCGEVVRGG